MKNNIFWKIFFRLTSEISAKLFVTIGKIFTEKMSKLFSTCSGKNWRNSFPKKFLFFMYIRTSSENFFEFWNFLFANLSKLLFTSSNELFDGTEFCENFLYFFIGLWLKIFWLTQKYVPKNCQNRFLGVQKTFWRNRFFRTFFSCSVHTRTLSKIISEFWDKCFRKIVKTASYASRRTLSWKTILLKKILHSLDFGWCIFLTDDNFIVAKISKLFSTTSGEHFDKKNFFEKHFLIFSGPWASYFLTFGKNFTERLFKLFCTCSENNFNMRIFSVVLFLAHTWILSKFFLTCDTNFSVKLSKLLSPCSDDYFDGKHFFGKFFNLASDFERKIFWTWVKNSQKSSQKRILRVQKSFWRNWFFGEVFDQYVY